MAEEQDLSTEGALRGLLAEVAVGDYRDKVGNALTNNTAFLEAVAALELLDLLERDGRPDGL